MEQTTIATDLAKLVFQVAVSHRPGHLDDERRLSRDRLLPFLAQQPPATIVLEACGSTHYWARQLQPFGHTVRLLPPLMYAHTHGAIRPTAPMRKGLLEANRNEEIHPDPSTRPSTKPLPRGTACGPPGSRRAPRGSIRSGACCANSASSSRSARSTSFPAFWSSRRRCPCCCARPTRRSVTRLRCWRRTCGPSNDSSGRSRPR